MCKLCYTRLQYLVVYSVYSLTKFIRMWAWLETLHKHSFDIRKEHVTDEVDELDIDNKEETENNSSVLKSTVSNELKVESEILNTNQVCSKQEEMIKNQI